jgi:hypothetical protein
MKRGEMNMLKERHAWASMIRRYTAGVTDFVSREFPQGTTA